MERLNARLRDDMGVAEEELFGPVLPVVAYDRFDEALEQYLTADRLFASQADRLGRSRALRGQAQVYLDTVRPLDVRIRRDRGEPDPA